MQELTKVKIAGREYPVKLDINVLEEIQESYGSVSEFERDILGLKYLKDEAGAQQYKEDGTPIIYAGEPSIKAIKLVLPLMINEGLKITADWENKEFDRIDAEEIYRECDVSFEVLAEIIKDEFRKCFAAKKQKPSKREKTSR